MKKIFFALLIGCMTTALQAPVVTTAGKPSSIEAAPAAVTSPYQVSPLYQASHSIITGYTTPSSYYSN